MTDVKNPATDAGTTETVKVYENQKTAELRQKLADLFLSIQKMQPGTPEANNAMLEGFKIQKEIEAEQNAMKRAEGEAKIQELRNQRIGLATAYKDAVLANTGKGKNDETQAAEDAAYEALVNELLSKYAAKTTAPVGDKPAGTKGETSKKILERYQFHLSTGLDSTAAKKAVIDEGYARGTVGAVVLAWEKETGVK